MNFKKSSAIFVLLLILLTPAISVLAQENGEGAIDYVALGDSLAAGITYQDELGLGYSDYLAKQLKQIDVLGNYTKMYSNPGYTSQQVLDDLINDVHKDFGGYEDQLGIQATVKNAEIVTLDVGANDMIAVMDIDPVTKTVSFDEVKFAAALEGVGNNIGKTITTLKTLNPDVKVYVMGYYNAFPYLPATEQSKIKVALSHLNETINTAAVETGAVFVPTSDAFDPNGMEYLPNPKNIHPNENGYLALANEFWQAIDIRAAIDFPDVDQNDWAQPSIQYLVEKGIIVGYESGEFGPEDSVRRDHAALMLTRSIVFGTDVKPAIFTDVSQQNPAYPMISVLVSNDILHGFPNGEFRPGESLTRAQMAKIIVDAFHLKGSGAATFSDVPAEHWASEEISILAENEITLGVGNDQFAPDQEVTREQFAAFIHRALVH